MVILWCQSTVICLFNRNYEHIVKAHQNNPQQGDQVSDQVKFNIFQSIMDSLFQSFSNSVSVNSFQELSACVFSWIEEHCTPQVGSNFIALRIADRYSNNYKHYFVNYELIIVFVLLLFFPRHWGSLWSGCSGSSVVSFIDPVKPLDWTPRLWARAGLSGWSKNFYQPQATPQYLHSLQLICASLAAIGLPQPTHHGQRWKVALDWAVLCLRVITSWSLSNCKCTYIDSWIYLSLCWLFVFLTVILQRNATKTQQLRTHSKTLQMNVC